MPEADILAHLSRPLEIASALKDLGHEVVFAGSGRYIHLATERGFPVVQATSLDKEQALACARSGRGNFLDDRVLRQKVAEDRRILKEVTPDLVLGDFRMSLTISCELDSFPLAMILNGTWTKSYAVRMKAPEHFLPTRLFGKRVVNILAPLLKRSVLWWDAAPFRRYRRELGLPVRTNLLDHWRGDLTLIADTPEFAPTTDLPPDYHYIGPIIWEPNLPAPPWLDELDPDRPVIYFTMGSTGHARFFELAVELFGNGPYQGIMTTAGLARFAHLPSNFRAVDYAPGSLLMQKSNLVVCQGGSGTIYQAMAAGCTITGIPTMHDQEFNLDRVEALGVGRKLSDLHFRKEHLSAAVEEVLQNPKIAENTARQATILSGYDGPRIGARLISAFLERPYGEDEETSSGKTRP